MVKTVEISNDTKGYASLKQIYKFYNKYVDGTRLDIDRFKEYQLDPFLLERGYTNYGTDMKIAMYVETTGAFKDAIFSINQFTTIYKLDIINELFRERFKFSDYGVEDKRPLEIPSNFAFKGIDYVNGGGQTYFLPFKNMLYLNKGEEVSKELFLVTQKLISNTLGMMYELDKDASITLFSKACVHLNNESLMDYTYITPENRIYVKDTVLQYARLILTGSNM